MLYVQKLRTYEQTVYEILSVRMQLQSVATEWGFEVMYEQYI